MAAQSAALLLMLAAPAVAQDRSPEPHVGPVTAVATAEVEGVRVVCAVSTAGLVISPRSAGTDDPDRTLVWTDPDLRIVDLAVVGPLLVVVGGVPARRGAVVWLEPTVEAGRPGALELARLEIGRDQVWSVTGLTDGSVVVGLDDGRVDLLAPPDAEGTPATPVELHRHAAPVRCVAAAGPRLVSGDRAGVLRILDLEAGPDRVPTEVVSHTAAVEAIAWGAAARRFGSVDRDGRLRVHDRDGQLLWSSERLGAAALAVAAGPGPIDGGSPDGSPDKGPDGDRQWFVGLVDGRILALCRTEPGGRPVGSGDRGPVHALATPAATADREALPGVPIRW